MKVNDLETIIKSVHTKLSAMVTAGDITQTESDSAFPILLNLITKNDTLEIS